MKRLRGKTDSFIAETATVNSSMPTYRYHIETERGERLESNIPDEKTATTVVNFLQERRTDKLTVVREQIYTVRGLGRDPDLH